MRVARWRIYARWQTSAMTEDHRPLLIDRRWALFRQLLDFFGKFGCLPFKVATLLLKSFRLLLCKFIQHRRTARAELRKLIVGTIAKFAKGFNDGDDLDLQRVIEPPQLCNQHLVTEVQTGPSLT